MSSDERRFESINENFRLLPDTSVIVAGTFLEIIENAVSHGTRVEVILPRYVIAEIEGLLNKKREVGLTGIKELHLLYDWKARGKIDLKVTGRRPTLEEIRLGNVGEIDALIREEASKNNAILVTSDHVQALLGRIEGLEVMYLERGSPDEAGQIEHYFISENVMSVHLKENCNPAIKEGTPGGWELRFLDEYPLMSQKLLEDIINDIIERARSEQDAFIEMEFEGCTVVQLQDMRIVITRPPFSDAIEVTAVRPIKRLTLSDYTLSGKLEERLREAEGILVCGSPGAGKSTFAQALADEYVKHGRIVKTLEKPRDLQVDEFVTQYSALEKDMEKTGNVLLLVRPDNVIYDELRDDQDFKVFADLRLAGVGMLGVIHASQPVDAIQRFVGRIELGMIPQVIDTVVYISNGDVANVLSLEMTVKVPAGMTASDLARPVILVRDFETDKTLYEIYTFGEQTVVMPLDPSYVEFLSVKSRKRKRNRPSSRYATMPLQELLPLIHQELQQKARHPVDIAIKDEQSFRVAAYVHPKDVKRILGKRGRTISRIEAEFGVKIDVYDRSKMKQSESIMKKFKTSDSSFYLTSSLTNQNHLHEEGIGGVILPHYVRETKKHVIIDLDVNPDLISHQEIEILHGDEPLAIVTVGRKGSIKIRKKLPLAHDLLSLLERGENLRWRLI